MSRYRKEHTDLTKKPLSFTEAAMLADNLESIEYFRQLQRRSGTKVQYDRSAPLPFMGKVMWLLLIGFIGYGFIGILYAVISTLLMVI